jgi:hypothetical protein
MDLGAGTNTDHAVAGQSAPLRVGVSVLPICC